MAYIGNTVQNQGFAPAVDYFNGDGTTVTFTLSRPVASVAQLTAVIENVIQNPSTAFTVSGSSITFTSAPPSGINNIWVEYTSLITTYAAISQDPTVIGDITATGGYSATGDYGNSFVDGVIVDYVTGNARITTGPSDGVTIYNGGTSARSALMTISSAGNVGIGTSSPTNKIHVSTTDVSAIRSERTGSASANSFLFNAGSSYNYGVVGVVSGNNTSTGDVFTLGYTPSAGTAVTGVLKWDSSGRVTTPYQPAFQAYCTGSTYITSGQVIPFNNTRFNTGSHFNTSTYRFTAPVAGVYCFQFQGYVASQNTWGNIQIRVSGSLYLYAETQAPYTQSLSPSIVVYLNAGDYVDSYWNTSAGKGFYLGSTESSFSGFLIG